MGGEDERVVIRSLDGEATLAYEMAAAISELTDTPITDTERSLYDYVDPEALEEAFRPNTNPAITFWVGDCLALLNPYESLVVCDYSLGGGYLR
jgi:hypothetical protein